MRILLVDDQAMFREAFSVLLQHAAARSNQTAIVETARTAAEGLVALAAKSPPFDLVLLDFFLPDESGPAAVAKFVTAAGDAPVVVISSADSAADAKDVLQFGASGYFSKSVSFAGFMELLSLVRSRTSRFAFMVLSRDGVGSLESRRAPPQNPIQPGSGNLTAHQREILRLICNGRTNKEIARTLGVEEATVKSHLRLMMRRAGLKNRTQLAMLGFEPNSSGVAAGPGIVDRAVPVPLLTH
jgi:two-component system, NarL family, nitrate/nitrite response regulator NarL